MAKSLDLKLSGLWTAPNDYTCPPGALDVADNVVIDQKNLGESRRGFETLIDNSGSGLDGFPVLSLTATELNTTVFDLLTYRYNASTPEGRLLLDDADTITGDNRFLPPPGAIRPRMLNWGEYIYVTSDEGIKRYSPSLNSSVPAGIPQALDLVLSLTGSSGYLTANEVAQITATVTSASPTLTVISNDDIQNFSIGQVITGTGIAAGTVVEDVTLSVPAVIHSATLTGGTATISIASNSGVAADQIVSGTGIQDDTRVVSIAGAGPYTVTISKNAIISGTEDVTFSTDNTVTMSANATSGAPTIRTLTLSTGSQVAYRLVWGLRNENDAVMLGAPSSFTVIENETGETRNVSANANIPSGISIDNFYQLYRSTATPTSSIVPADQMQLVVEGVPTPTDISNGFIVITDQTPDSLKGESLYTGSDVEGISQANYRPPTAADTCNFRGYTLYSNFTQTYQIKMIIDGVGAPSGVQIGDEITIATASETFTLTAAAAEDTATGEFLVVTSGTPAQNIADTAASFIRVLNRFADNTICYAYLISGPNDLPGQILLEARPSQVEFGIVANTNGTAWTPNIDTEQLAIAENIPNGVLVSKVQEPEAAPRVNLFTAGGIGNQILRAIPLRDYVIILTTDGVFRMTGQTLSDFAIEPFDLTVQVAAAETACALGNECWVLSTAGVVSISDGGVRIRSGLQINNVLQSLVRQAPNSVSEYAFAVAYESDQRYILALPDTEGDTTCTQQYCYNYITENWTRWTRNCTAGYVNKQTGLYLGNGSDANIVLERKNGDFTDYVDESFDVTISVIDDTTITLSSVSGIEIGDILWQDQAGVELYAEVTEVDFAGNTVEVSQTIDWDLGAAKILTAIDCVIQWKPMASGDPTEAKQHSEGQIVLRSARFLNADMQIASDVSASFEGTPLEGQPSGGWGLLPWGEFPWGGVSRPKTLRFYIPANKQYCGALICRFELRSGYSQWALEGGSIAVFDIGFELGGPGGDE